MTANASCPCPGHGPVLCWGDSCPCPAHYGNACPDTSPCCDCCRAAVERGEAIGHVPDVDPCPHPPCDYHQPTREDAR